MKIDCIKVLVEEGSTVIFEGTFNVTLPVRGKRFKLVDVEITEKEEEILQNLNHQNVVKLLHVESDRNFRYLAQAIQT